MTHTSEPQSIPLGVVATVPCRPVMLIRSALGLTAASNGVFPSSSSSGWSAAPSGMMITYFMTGYCNPLWPARSEPHGHSLGLPLLDQELQLVGGLADALNRVVEVV